MHVRRELLVGLGAFLLFGAAAFLVGLGSTDATVRSLSLPAAVGAGGGMSALVALAYHLALGPRGARYEPTTDAWGLAEMDDRSR